MSQQLSAVGVRKIVLWIPDWPISSLAVAVPPGTPAVAVHRGEVVSSTRTARVMGIRRGMRQSTAQQFCEDLLVLPHDRQRDNSAFEVILQIFDQQVAEVCAIRPGLAWAPVGGATRWSVDENELIASLAEQVASETGLEAYLGIASGPVAAVAAARRGISVAESETQNFLDSLKMDDLLAFLSTEQSQQYRSAIKLLKQLGIQQIDQLRNLGPRHLATRFGQVGQKLWSLATGGDLFVESKAAEPTSLQVATEFDPPAIDVAQTLVQVRQVSQNLVDRLSRRGLHAQSMRIDLESGEGVHYSRSWALFDLSSSAQISQRIIWQIRGWQDGQQRDGAAGNSTLQSVSLVAINPTSQSITDSLWGGTPRSGKVNQTLTQVQVLLGENSVTQPHLSGGNDPRSRLTWLPWGASEPLLVKSGEWAGSIQDTPVVLFDNPPSIKLIGQKTDGTWGGIWVDPRGVLGGSPQRVIVLESRPELESGSYLIESVRGLWTMRGHWWADDIDGPTARCYLRATLVGGLDILLIQVRGQWQAEGLYAEIFDHYG